MKQLVNKYDRRIRLVGLDDVLIEGRTGEALAYSVDDRFLRQPSARGT